MRERANLPAAIPAYPPEPFPYADQYLLASLMQKAIRRGNLPIARRAAYQLHSLDRQRLWRRLMVTALEDIGIAGTETAAELVALGALPAARKLMGGDLPALDRVLASACMAAKDRTADHLLSILSREPFPASDLRAVSGKALLAITASSEVLWQRRLHAAALAAGRTDPVHPGAPGIAALLALFADMGVPELLIAACAGYAARQRDLLPVLVPFAWLLHEPGFLDRTIKAHAPPPAELIAGWPAYSFDPLWTRTGKRAVRLWLRSYLTIPQFTERQVAACVWNAEAAICDRTLTWPLGDELRQRAYVADLRYRGLPVERHADLCAWVVRERPALMAARQAVWNSVLREAGRAAKGPEQANLPLPVPERRSRRG